jgi:hypothetical protein
VSLIFPLILVVFFTVSSQALADCEGPCSAESEITGLAHPPAWAAGKAVHFEPASAEAAATPQTQNGLVSEDGLPEGLEHAEQLLYHSAGNIQHYPIVHLVLWGSNFESTQAGKETDTMLQNLYEDLTNSAWQGTLTQYFSENGANRVGKTVAFGEPYIDKSVAAPKELRYESEVTAEMEKAIKTEKWLNEENSQFVIVTAPGTTYYKNPGSEETTLLGKGCAYHNYTGTFVYDFVPYQGDEPLVKDGCVSTGNPNKNPVDKTSKSASHEFAEATTDPKITAWRTKNGSEVADLCSEREDFELPGSIAWVQPLFNNDALECTDGISSPPLNYAATERVICRIESGVRTAEFTADVDPEGGSSEYWFEAGYYPHLNEWENPTTKIPSSGGLREIKSAKYEVSPNLYWRVRGNGFTLGETKETGC